MNWQPLSFFPQQISINESTCFTAFKSSNVKNTARLSFISVLEQLEQKYSLVYCGSIYTILILKHPTKFEFIVQMMGGFCMVNVLLWEIPEGVSVKDTSTEPGIFC